MKTNLFCHNTLRTTIKGAQFFPKILTIFKNLCRPEK